MIAGVIRWSANNRLLVLLGAVALLAPPSPVEASPVAPDWPPLAP